jgi:hypothetical protein
VSGFSRAVKLGPFLSFRRTARAGPNGKSVDAGDAAARTRRFIATIKAPGQAGRRAL